MRLSAVTAYRENYGAHDWSGEGECPQYWKNKGTYEYVVEIDDEVFAKMEEGKVTTILSALVSNVTYQKHYASESLIETAQYPTGRKTPIEEEFERFLADDLATEDERKYYAPKVVTLEELGFTH